MKKNRAEISIEQHSKKRSGGARQIWSGRGISKMEDRPIKMIEPEGRECRQMRRTWSEAGTKPGSPSRNKGKVKVTERQTSFSLEVTIP